MGLYKYTSADTGQKVGIRAGGVFLLSGIHDQDFSDLTMIDQDVDGLMYVAIEKAAPPRIT